MVAQGRMRTIWYQRGEAEYLTRELAKSLGKYTLVERDPGFMPIVVEKAKKQEGEVDEWGQYVVEGQVRERLMTPAENVQILDTVLPPTIRFYRATINLNSESLHGSVTSADVATAIKMIAGASQHPDGNRVVVTAENITFAHDSSNTGKLKELGEYEVIITYKGEEEVVTRQVFITRDDEGLVGSVGASAGETGGEIATEDTLIPPENVNVLGAKKQNQVGNIFGQQNTRSNIFRQAGGGKQSL
ncbi:hypothetical protein ABW20_dc0104763 [Dactylellina cionopaga]|nr:hypothetical protein ABW20_dc0104763 [Dactylellina cionopaga]